MLEWLPQGTHRMRLLQIALRYLSTLTDFPAALPVQNPTDNAVQDFLNACAQQLSIGGNESALRILANIIENWKPVGETDEGMDR